MPTAASSRPIGAERLRRLREQCRQLKVDPLTQRTGGGGPGDRGEIVISGREEWLVLGAEGMQLYASDPLPIRRARAIAHVLGHVEIAILPDEVVVGEVGLVEPAAAWPERFQAAQAFWKEFNAPLLASVDTRLYEAHRLTGVAGGGAGRGGHVVPDFARVLRLGLGGVIAQVREAAPPRPGESATAGERRRLNCEAWEIALRGVGAYARRHAELARRLAAASTDRWWADELREIADVCDRVAWDPPRTFREALQLTRFVYLAAKMDDGGAGVAYGRFDQYLFPFVQADLASGRATLEDVRDLVTALVVKQNHQVEEVTSLTIGGVDAAGRDATNELSYACLEAVRRVRLRQPNLAVRLHSGCPEAFLADVCRTMADGVGHPQVYNDDLLVAALISYGVPAEHAREFSLMGCVHTFLAGREAPWQGDWVVPPKLLEVTLHGGVDPRTGVPVGPRTPAPDSFETLEALLAAFEAQLLAATRGCVTNQIAYDRELPQHWCTPLNSPLLEACLERGRDAYDGGAIYENAAYYICGLGTAADSLAAIERFVYREHRLSLAELVAALDADFAGAEELRQLLWNRTPRYGNDDDAADRFAVWIARVVSDEVLRHQTEPWHLKYAMLGSAMGHIRYGRVCGATPDGRRAGEPFSDGASPVQGMARQGPTALVRSVCKIDFSRITGGNAVNMKFHPSALRSPEGLDRLASLLRTHMRGGGPQLQVNCVDRAILLDALAHPERHRDLVVRLAGFNVYFVTLSPDAQREVIARTEFE